MKEDMGEANNRAESEKAILKQFSGGREEYGEEMVARAFR